LQGILPKSRSFWHEVVLFLIHAAEFFGVVIAGKLKKGIFMALQLTSDSDQTIKLEPIPPADFTNVRITSADYGAPARPVVAADRMSVSFTVKDGLNALVITLDSTSQNNETVQLTLDGDQVAMVTVRQHSGASAIDINGTNSQ